MSDFLTAKEKLILLAPVLFIFLVLIIVFKGVDSEEYFLDYLPKTEYRGIIIKKYIDNHNHASETIVLLNSKTNSDTIIAPGEWIGLWEASKINDSLVKEEGLDYLKLYRKAPVEILTFEYYKNQPGFRLMKRFH